MSKKHKKIREQQLLATQQREELISKMLKFSRKRFKRFDEVIMQLYLGEDLRSFFADQRIMKVHACFTNTSKTNAMSNAILRDVFLYLNKRSSLLSDEEYIGAVFNMVQFRAYWLKDIFEWKPTSSRAAAQVDELAFYLFCRYDVPLFMYRAFYEQTNMIYINWFMHLGTGGKAKELNKVPINFTQKMAHYFLQAPPKFSIAEALRWAQVKGMMGDDRLAERIAYSWIGTKPYEDEDFWESFIRIMATGGMLDHEKLTEVIDYVRDTKIADRNYSLKGRTLLSLIRQSDEWHKRATVIKVAKVWSACGIKGYRIEKKQDMILMEELTGSKLLADEGRKMKHCVVTYAHNCVAGKTAIFSMRKYFMGLLTETMATIEVNLLLKRIVQAKSKMNTKISEEALKHLNAWADQNDLVVGCYL